jgi:hypothetical protein
MNIKNTINKATSNIRQYLPTIRNTQHTRYNEYYQYQAHPMTRYQNLQYYYIAARNPVVYRCNKVWKNTALACDFSIDTDTREDDNLPTKEYLNRLFNQPLGYNSQMTWADMSGIIWDSKDNMGDAFFEISTDADYNIMNGFKYIHNSRIMFDPDTQCYSLKEQPQVQYEPNELIHIREPDINPEQMAWGISKIDRARDFIALHMNAVNYNNDVLNNDGVDPNIILSFDPSVNNRNMQGELDRLTADKNKGIKRKFLALKGATVQHTNYNTKDMHYLQLIDHAEDGIIRVYGVPPQLYGKIETASLGSGSGDSQKKDWKTTFEGESVYVENAFNNTLKYYGFTERFHYKKIDVIDELYEAQVAQIQLQSGLKTRDEIRNEMGLDKITDLWENYYR